MGLILIIGMEMGTEERDTAAKRGLPLEGTEKGLYLPEIGRASCRERV